LELIGGPRDGDVLPDMGTNTIAMCVGQQKYLYLVAGNRKTATYER
ncbi:unnamed protein product, partial [marine sediment metagenome]